MIMLEDEGKMFIILKHLYTGIDSSSFAFRVLILLLVTDICFSNGHAEPFQDNSHHTWPGSLICFCMQER